MNRNADLAHWLDTKLNKALEVLAQEGRELNKTGYMTTWAELVLMTELLVELIGVEITDDTEINDSEMQCIGIAMNIENEGKILPSDIKKYNTEEANRALARYAVELQRILHINT